MLRQRIVHLGVFIALFLVLCGCQNNAVPAGTTPPPATPTTMPTDPAAAAETEAEPAMMATVLVTVVVTATPQPESEAVPEEATPEPTATPLPPEPTATPMPEPTAVPTPVPIVGPPWLNLLNHVREMAGLTAVPEKHPLTVGSQHHSRYMVVNDAAIAHKEDTNNPLYDEAGDLAAKNGNLFATSQTEATYVWGINFWVSAPFHLVRMLHPDLLSAGYGDFVADGGNINMAAVLDVGTDRSDTVPEDVTYPIIFPGDGTETWVVRHSLYEWPDPFGSCPGYMRPSGPPIIVQLGDGSITPSVTNFSVSQGGKALEACLFDETSYRNADSYAQGVGRTVLDLQDAIVIIPRQPLAADSEYTVQLEANGESYAWSFKTIKRAPTD